MMSRYECVTTYRISIAAGRYINIIFPMLLWIHVAQICQIRNKIQSDMEKAFLFQISGCKAVRTTEQQQKILLILKRSKFVWIMNTLGTRNSTSRSHDKD